MTNGPIETGFMVYQDFMSYAGGIYTCNSNVFMGGHAVKILGWGEESGTKFWLVANSWGTSWGEKGYFRLEIGQSKLQFEAGMEEKTTVIVQVTASEMA